MKVSKDVSGQRIYAARQNKNMSQGDLAASLNTSRQVISSYERGVNMPPVVMYAKLANALDVSAAYLQGVSDDPTPETEMSASRIKDARESRGLTLKELSEKTGISASSLSKYERGERTPKIEVLQKLASFFGVSVEFLRGRGKLFSPLFTAENLRKAQEMSEQARKDFFTKISNEDVIMRKASKRKLADILHTCYQMDPMGMSVYQQALMISSFSVVLAEDDVSKDKREAYSRTVSELEDLLSVIASAFKSGDADFNEVSEAISKLKKSIQSRAN